MKTMSFLPLTCAGILIAAMALSSCSELKKDLPAPTTETGIHSPGWNDPNSSEFHGVVLKKDDYDLDECVRCHAKSFAGGTSGVSCAGCHQSYPHKPGWSDTSSTQFHGRYLHLMGGNTTECAQCHGSNFSGGTSGVSCYGCHASYPHKADWTNPSSVNSHGQYLKGKNWQTAECASCHGADYTGGSSGESCFTCHPSYPHTVFGAFGGHAGYLYGKSYPMNQCKTCHGAAYAGGSVVNISCMKSGCHVDASGTAKSPEACNTCHGQFQAPATDALSAAPPKSVLGDSLESAHGVGAHRKHLATGQLGKAVKCQECHTSITTVFITGHLDTPVPAEVVFGDTLARLKTADGTYAPSPSYSATTVKCSNVYCHGNWKLRRATSPYKDYAIFTDSAMVGSKYAPAWIGAASEATCGSCHGLPPVGHVMAALSECATCHGEVVNGSGNIIDKTKHVNGKINVWGSERNF
jgi:predicted CxxxxCH...CXXCH cytochrome family protein